MKIDATMLRDAMYELGLSTYQLGAAAGIPQPLVSNILLGTRSPGLENLKAICDVLEIDINDVFIKEEEITA